MGMQGMAALLAAYVLVAVFGLAVLAAFAVSGSLGRKADRLTERGQEIASYQLLRPPPGTYPPEVSTGQPAVPPPNHRPLAPPPPFTPQPPPPPPVAPRPVPKATVSSAELRLWARDSGLRVADRGPIPAHVREAWAKANL